jgi:uncharacterized SAM-dependent methyltransferase
MIHDVFATTGIIDVQGAPRGAGGSFAADAISGLSARHERLPPKYFYDASGSRLFSEICRTDEYYVDRSETLLLRSVSPRPPSGHQQPQ